MKKDEKVVEVNQKTLRRAECSVGDNGLRTLKFALSDGETIELDETGIMAGAEALRDQLTARLGQGLADALGLSFDEHIKTCESCRRAHEARAKAGSAN